MLTITRQELFDIQRALESGEGCDEAVALIEDILNYTPDVALPDIETHPLEESLADEQ